MQAGWNSSDSAQPGDKAGPREGRLRARINSASTQHSRRGSYTGGASEPTKDEAPQGRVEQAIRQVGVGFCEAYWEVRSVRSLSVIPCLHSL